MRKIISNFLLSTSFLLLPLKNFLGNFILKLAWDKNPDIDPIIGYRRFCGEESRNFKNKFDVGNIRTGTISCLELESEHSNEVISKIPSYTSVLLKTHVLDKLKVNTDNSNLMILKGVIYAS